VITFAVASSSSRVKRGRSMMWRLAADTVCSLGLLIASAGTTHPRA
jgi:hypothetical protein